MDWFSLLAASLSLTVGCVSQDRRMMGCEVDIAALGTYFTDVAIA